MAYDLDWVISVDDHIIEPDDVWTHRMPQKFKDQAPKLVRGETTEAWVFAGKRRTVWGLTACAGKDTDEFSIDPITYAEMRPSCYNSKARLADMDRDGTLATGTFPSYPGLCGQTFLEQPDRELALACIQAYNDFVLDEWVAVDRKRFIAKVIVPLWDPFLAVKEAERCKLKGAHAILFPERPASLADGAGGFLPSIHDMNGYWEPLLTFANDSGMPLCIHIGASGDIDTTSPDAPMHVVSNIVRLVSPQKCAMDWLFSGWFSRLPNLKVCLSEGGVGWIPALLDILDYSWRTSYAWNKKAGQVIYSADFSVSVAQTGFQDGAFRPFDIDEQLNRDFTPSQLFRRHMYGCFLQDEYGRKTIADIGADNVMLESDFPHGDSTWPNTAKRANQVLSEYSEEDRYKIFRGNAMRVFQFEPAPIPVRKDTPSSAPAPAL